MPADFRRRWREVVRKVSPVRPAAGWSLFVDVGQVQLDGCFAFDACIDPGFAQRLQIGLRIAVGQVALECDGACR